MKRISKKIPDTFKQSITETVNSVKNFIISVPDEHRYNISCEILDRIGKVSENFSEENIGNRLIDVLTELSKGDMPEELDASLIKQQEEFRKLSENERKEQVKNYEENLIKHIPLLKVKNDAESLQEYIDEADERFENLINDIYHSYKPPFLLRLFSFTRTAKEVISFNKDNHIKQKQSELSQDDKDFLFHRGVEDVALKYMEY